MKDRLCGYYHWNDPQCLDQAVAVARRQALDLREIERWSAGEGMSKRLGEFLERLERSR